MRVCAVCGLPMVWSTDRNRQVCAVYGDHPGPTPGALMLAADAEMEALDRSRLTRFQRKDRP